jgi:hypothetical protein
MKSAVNAVEKVTTTEVSGDTISVLSEIAKSDKAGIAAKDLAVKCGLGSAKGLSGLMRKARQVISEKSGGKSIGKYLWKKRTRDRGAVWYVNSQKLRDIGVIQ